MKPTKETNDKTWTDQEWPGNPELKLAASCKLFKNPFNGKMIPVWVFGGNTGYLFSFCVSAGAYSDYSYTGGFYPQVVSDMSIAKNLVDNKALYGKLIY